MQSSSKRNEHPRCGCPHCRNGAASKSGQHVHRQVNRRIRHRYHDFLRSVDDTPVIVISTPYTD
jgi:hypothetical protein